MHKGLLSLTLAAAVSVATPALAQELTEEQQVSAIEFALNNSRFVMMHEIGHLLVAELDLPVLGREEDAADSLATLMLLTEDNDDAVQALIDSADGWYLSDLSSGEEFETSDFYGEHSLDLQRAYQVVCLSVGANPEAFAEVAAEYEMDAERQESCAFDYAQAANSWAGLLEPHTTGGNPGPGDINIVYEPSNEEWQGIENLLRETRFLENAALAVYMNYALPRDVTFRATLCGEENAWYSFDEAAVTFCYDLVAHFFRLIEQDMLAAVEE